RARAQLESYAWPGNIRELRNIIERAVLMCDGQELLPEHLSPKVTGGSNPPASTSTPAAAVADSRNRLLQQGRNLQRKRVVEALAQAGGNQTKAAQILGISRRTLVTRLGDYNLPRPRKRS